VDEIFPGAGAVITNLARFGDWERWNYDWDLDVEPTLREIAESQVPGWMPGGLLYFDKPIARRYHARIAGLTAHPRRAVIQARELSVAEKRAYLENWGLTRAGSAEVNARIKAEGLAERWHMIIMCLAVISAYAVGISLRSYCTVSAPCQHWALRHER